MLPGRIDPAPRWRPPDDLPDPQARRLLGPGDQSQVDPDPRRSMMRRRRNSRAIALKRAAGAAAGTAGSGTAGLPLGGE
jgi:hypothetical protein